MCMGLNRGREIEWKQAHLDSWEALLNQADSSCGEAYYANVKLMCKMKYFGKSGKLVHSKPVLLL